MRRKVIQHYADVLCRMAIGWRMGNDLEKLAELPDGALRFDLLNGSAVHSVAGEVDLCIAREMQGWLKTRLLSDHIPQHGIREAEIRLESRTNRIGTDRKKIVSFDWNCESRIATDEKTYEGRLSEAQTWHNRVTNAPEV